MSDLHRAVESELEDFRPDRTPPFSAILDRSRARNGRHRAALAVGASSLAVAALAVGAGFFAGAADRLPGYAAPTAASEPLADDCRGAYRERAQLEGPAADRLRVRLAQAVPASWQGPDPAGDCAVSLSGRTPFGGQPVRSVTVPYARADRPESPPTTVVLVQHEEPTPEVVAEQYARNGGPTKLVPGEGQTLTPDLVFENRLLAEARPAGSHIWVYETLQTVCGVLWSDDGTAALILVPKDKPDVDALAAEVERVLTNLAT